MGSSNYLFVIIVLSYGKSIPSKRLDFGTPRLSALPHNCISRFPTTLPFPHSRQPRQGYAGIARVLVVMGWAT
jgi:hypothetical protein